MDQNQELINVLVGAVIPLIVAFVTARSAPPMVKSLTLVFLATLGSVITTVTAQADWTWAAFGTALALQYVSAVAAHFGVLKPAAVTGSNGAIQVAVPGGLGSADPGFDEYDAPQPPMHP